MKAGDTVRYHTGEEFRVRDTNHDGSSLRVHELTNKALEVVDEKGEPHALPMARTLAPGTIVHATDCILVAEGEPAWEAESWPAPRAP